ncbi:hypothetical protein [Deinococcus peraridilitoris]|uniref:YtkA-like domain-containing protein n=1 Tax=Deinococcus peraridilitoris (strain DSM 19664 / LMG 22246 / CIP 109416 / KR-200) TaxID=937777 RepID=L0A483_DEIPD|nr:hypothetical protein [Deinococcus peraridilitoris]AFZ67997.1 hypothetical protein Deipe_2532 [Deinococcus peraridilitoris DSM 19664]
MKHLLLFTLLLGASALAHEIVRDGNVGALLHIEPDDDPVVGKVSATWFETRARGGRPITLTNCNCTVSVYAGSVQPHKKPVLTPKLKSEKNRLGVDLVFPAEGAYTLVLSGMPKNGATFNAFRLEWVVRAGGTGGHDH